MSLYERLLCGQDAAAVIGLGYVGMPLAVAMCSEKRVIIDVKNIFTVSAMNETQEACFYWRL